MKNLTITLIEVGNTEAPNIGTVIHKGDDVDFMDRIKTALEEHFDAQVKSFTVLDGLVVTDVRNSPPLDAIVVMDVFGNEAKYQIEIHQTWIY